MIYLDVPVPLAHLSVVRHVAPHVAIHVLLYVQGLPTVRAENAQAHHVCQHAMEDVSIPVQVDVPDHQLQLPVAIVQIHAKEIARVPALDRVGLGVLQAVLLHVKVDAKENAPEIVRANAVGRPALVFVQTHVTEASAMVAVLGLVNQLVKGLVSIHAI